MPILHKENRKAIPQELKYGLRHKLWKSEEIHPSLIPTIKGPGSPGPVD